MTDILYREDILAYRMTWIEFLERPDTKKATEMLDYGDGSRCCLGHGAHCLGVVSRAEKEYVAYGALRSVALAPEELLEMVGLWDGDGSTMNSAIIADTGFTMLSEVNDNTDWTPQQIGAYLRTAVEGGEDTPFKPLSDYPTRPV